MLLVSYGVCASVLLGVQGAAAGNMGCSGSRSDGGNPAGVGF